MKIARYCSKFLFYIEFEYQKSVQRFNRFLDEVMNMNVWKYIDKYNNIFMQENL